jgi:ribosomal protein S6--L-glutamate ligase
MALIHHFELQGVPVFNGFRAVRTSRHQFYTLQSLCAAGIAVPDSVYVNSVDGFSRAVTDLGGYPVVVKEVSRRQGSGVLKIDSPERSPAIIAAHLEKPQKERQGLLIQRYLPPSGRQDVRTLVVGQKVIGAQLMISPPGDFRANFHLSGLSRSFEVTPEIEDLSIRAARAVGLDIAGVDIMVENGGTPLVGEVNYAPGFKGLEAATKQDVAGKIIDYVSGRLKHMEH